MNVYSTRIGVDLGDKKRHFAGMVSESDDRVEEGVLQTTKAAFARKFSNLPRSRAVHAGLSPDLEAEITNELTALVKGVALVK